MEGFGAPARRKRSEGHSDDGAVDETRTRDLNLGKVALYQLSYYRVSATPALPPRRDGADEETRTLTPLGTRS